MALKGRSWLAIWLVAFLGVLAWVVARQTAAHVQATELRIAQERRSSLEAQRGAYLRRIGEAGSRTVLVPRAKSLGLRLAADSEILFLPLPSPVR